MPDVEAGFHPIDGVTPRQNAGPDKLILVGHGVFEGSACVFPVKRFAGDC